MKRALLLLHLTACGAAVEPDAPNVDFGQVGSPEAGYGSAIEPATSRAGIIGGDLDTGDPEVFYLDIRGGFGTSNACTATLIGSRTLLTAAHCLDPIFNGGSVASVRATNDVSGRASGNFIGVLEWRLHPSWTFANPYAGDDIALALLLRPPAGVAPKPWNEADVSGHGGRPLRATACPGASVTETREARRFTPSPTASSAWWACIRTRRAQMAAAASKAATCASTATAPSSSSGWKRRIHPRAMSTFAAAAIARCRIRIAPPRIRRCCRVAMSPLPRPTLRNRRPRIPGRSSRSSWRRAI